MYVDAEKNYGYPRKGNKICYGFRRDVGVEQFKQSHIVHYPAQEFAGLFVVKVIHGKRLYGIVSFDAQFKYQAPGGPVRTVVT